MGFQCSLTTSANKEAIVRTVVGLVVCYPGIYLFLSSELISVLTQM